MKITCKDYNYFRNTSFGFKNLNLELGDKHNTQKHHGIASEKKSRI